MNRQPDHYETLGVPRDADLGAIKRAYRRQAKLAHPDTPGGDQTRFTDLNDAYHALRNSQSRREHDHLLRAREGTTGLSDWVPDVELDRFACGHGWGLSHLFDLFGGITGARRWWTQPTRLATDVRMDLELTPAEAAQGVLLPIELSEQDLASVRRSLVWNPTPFSALVAATIPPGVAHGELFRYRFQDGEGNGRMLQLRIVIAAG